MTLCLAAVCDSGKTIACAFDDQLTTVTTAGDVLTKAARVNKLWLLLFAGDDIRHVGTVYDRVKRGLLQANNVTLPRAQNAVLDVRDEVIRENLQHGPLRPLAVSVPEFLARSHQLVADQRQRDDLIDRVGGARLGSDFLLAGFDERQQPHIVTVLDEEDRATNHDRHGYGAVGSGSYVAEHHLVMLNYTRHFSALTAGYALCAAKFMAESAYVGKKFHVSMLKSDGSMWTLDTERVRALWETNGRPRIPVDVASQMPPLKLLQPKPSAPAVTPKAKSTPTRPKRDQKGRTP